MKFHKGDKVKCIDDDFTNIYTDPAVPPEYKTLKFPKKREKPYTVREQVQTEIGWGLRLKEIKNPKVYHQRGGYKEPAFSPTRFIIVKSAHNEKKKRTKKKK